VAAIDVRGLARASRRSSTFGLTLLELLTVIVIVGILVTLLIPVFSTVRSRAQRHKAQVISTVFTWRPISSFSRTEAGRRFVSPTPSPRRKNMLKRGYQRSSLSGLRRKHGFVPRFRTCFKTPIFRNRKTFAWITMPRLSTTNRLHRINGRDSLGLPKLVMSMVMAISSFLPMAV
jgi:hypothetical protein